jgi:hypothetical protein
LAQKNSLFLAQKKIGTEEFPVFEIIYQYWPLHGQCKYVSIPFEENSLCFAPIAA